MAKNTKPKKMFPETPKSMVNIIENKVKNTKNGLRLPAESEIIPKTSPKAATKNIEIPKDILQKISGTFFSMVTQQTKYKETIFKAKN